MGDQHTAITDDWLLSVDFKWSQDDRQPNKHFKLIANQFDESGTGYGSAAIETQRSGWRNRKGEYVGNPDEWMLWLTDQFGSRVFVGHIKFVEQIIQVAQIVSGHSWNPANHVWGQTWPDGRHAQQNEEHRE